MFEKLLSPILQNPWLQSANAPTAIAVLIALVVICELFMAPITPFDLLAGILLGFPAAVPVMLLAKALSAAANFHLAQSIFHKTATRLTARIPILQGLQHAVSQGGWKLAFLFRLCPIPFGLVSYAFGLTRLHSLHHLSATTCAVLLPTLAFTAIGASTKNQLAALGSQQPSNPWEKVLLIIGLIAGVLVIRYVSRTAMLYVQKNAEAQQESSPAAPSDPPQP